MERARAGPANVEVTRRMDGALKVVNRLERQVRLKTKTPTEINSLSVY